MKIIISHDVDHLYPSDHILRDLIYPKLWIRSLINIFRREISISVFIYRLLSIFESKTNKIYEILQYDKENGIPSVFFFGMDNALGMSYKKDKTIKYIEYIKEQGYDVGVHGVNYTDSEKMFYEYMSFKEISGMESFGMRMHYVRYDSDTFNKLSNIGYIFDCSYFNKKEIEYKAPYKVGDMWEFPLHIMDGYILVEGNLEKSKHNTMVAFNNAIASGIPYLTILFHDRYFNDKQYPIDKAWYEWLIEYLKCNGHEFISYRYAIEEMENSKSDRERINLC